MQREANQQIRELATTAKTGRTDEPTYDRPTTPGASRIAKTNPGPSVTTGTSETTKTNPTTAMTPRPSTWGDPFGARPVTEASTIKEVRCAEISAPRFRHRSAPSV